MPDGARLLMERRETADPTHKNSRQRFHKADHVGPGVGVAIGPIALQQLARSGPFCLWQHAKLPALSRPRVALPQLQMLRCQRLREKLL